MSEADRNRVRMVRFVDVAGPERTAQFVADKKAADSRAARLRSRPCPYVVFSDGGVRRER